MSNINGPIPEEWGGYVTQSNVGLEVIPHILYDTQTYTTAVTTILPFFTSVPANDAVSNVNPPATLPNPSSFLIKNIGIFFPNTFETVVQGGAAAALASQFNDILLLVNTGIARLTIGDKPYGPWPMYRLPIGTFPKQQYTAAGAAAANVITAGLRGSQAGGDLRRWRNELLNAKATREAGNRVAPGRGTERRAPC
jgi:hypothetical protein